MSILETIGTGTQTSGNLSSDSTREHDAARRQELGQFLTPPPVADFMASLFELQGESISILDAGAGAGALTKSLVGYLCQRQNRPSEISVTAYELDENLINALNQTLDSCKSECGRLGIRYSAIVHNSDFIEATIPSLRGDLFAKHSQKFTAAIANPPYRKIRSDSAARSHLRSAGIETTNLYTAFLSLIVRLLADKGELVAITPRSFCNGPYFRPFRQDFLTQMSLRQIHVFESRSAAFNGDGVLQENVIVRAIKSRQKPEEVLISSSSGANGTRISERQVGYPEVVSPRDLDQFIHLVADDGQAKARDWMRTLKTTLGELGLSVSTGRVVDFRARQFLRKHPSDDTVPLIYPCHFSGGFIQWPKENGRKPNAIVSEARTLDLLVPAETYVLVKRFTSKEERRRVVACIFDPERVRAKAVGFENHLNYFHMNGHGLPSPLAKGLAAFLNSAVLDNYFRQFNGHTQVNATDLRNLRYPTMKQMLRLGDEVTDPAGPQEELDALLMKELDGKAHA